MNRYDYRDPKSLVRVAIFGEEGQALFPNEEGFIPDIYGNCMISMRVSIVGDLDELGIALVKTGQCGYYEHAHFAGPGDSLCVQTGVVDSVPETDMAVSIFYLRPDGQVKVRTIALVNDDGDGLLLDYRERGITLLRRDERIIFPRYIADDSPFTRIVRDYYSSEELGRCYLTNIKDISSFNQQPHKRERKISFYERSQSLAGNQGIVVDYSELCGAGILAAHGQYALFLEEDICPDSQGNRVLERNDRVTFGRLQRYLGPNLYPTYAFSHYARDIICIGRS